MTQRNTILSYFGVHRVIFVVGNQLHRMYQKAYWFLRLAQSVCRANYKIFKLGSRLHWTGRLLWVVGDFKLIQHANASQLAQHYVRIKDAQIISYEAPEIFGPTPSGWDAPWESISVTFPALTVCQWANAKFLGRSDSIYLQNYAINNDHWRPATELTYDEVHGFIVNKQTKLVLSRFADLPTRHIERAIVIVGGPCCNWAHWTTEYLPKIALIDLDPQYHNWPVLVDAKLDTNIIDSLKLVGSLQHEIIHLHEGELITVDKSVTVTSTGYSAYEYRYDKTNEVPKFKREHTVYSPYALNLVRERAWNSLNVVANPSRKIYITRPKGSARRFTGAEEVENYFAAEGFELIDTGRMSFEEQVRLFADACCVVGQSGAGMANIVFAEPGCSVIVFAANSPHSIFHYFANMGAALGHKMHYCYGESIYTLGEHPGHAGFSVELSDVRSAWSKTKATIEDLSI